MFISLLKNHISSVRIAECCFRVIRTILPTRVDIVNYHVRAKCGIVCEGPGSLYEVK